MAIGEADNILGRLKQYRSEVEGWLIHLPSQGE